MRNNILLWCTAFLLAASTIACNNKEDELKYNDTIVRSYTSFNQKLGPELKMAKSSDDSLGTANAIAALEKCTDSCIVVLNGLKPSADAKEFHAAIAKVYNTVKLEYLPTLKQIESITQPDSVMDVYNESIKNLKILNQRLSQEQAAAQQAQQAYATKLEIKLR